MKIMVTGANGYLGKNFIQKLLENEENTVVGFSTNFSHLNHKNYSEYEIVLDEYNYPKNLKDFDILYHFGWSGSMGDLRMSPAMQNINILNTVNMFMAAEKMKVKKIVGIGTISELEAIETLNGNTPRNNNFLYGLAKITTHEELKILCEQSSIAFNWARLGNVYHEEDESPKFLNIAVTSLLKNEHLETTFGSQYYDFVHLNDALNAIELVGEDGVNGKSYYIGSGEVKTIKEFILELKELTNSNSTINFDPEKVVKGLPHEAFSIAELTTDTGYRIEGTFRSNMEKIIKHRKEEFAENSINTTGDAIK